MTPLGHIWNGWRAAYVQGTEGTVGVPDGRSVFTRILASGMSDVEANVVHRGPLCFAILNAFPYTTGHTLVLPYREVADIVDLTTDEATELWSTVTAARIALQRAMNCNGVNIGINLGTAAGGSVSEHLHVHVVARWTGDSNFMTAVANTRTIPEALPDTAAKVRAAWPRVD